MISTRASPTCRYIICVVCVCVVLVCALVVFWFLMFVFCFFQERYKDVQQFIDFPLQITDQFIIRFLEGVLTTEICIRLKNGQLSTEREASKWDHNAEIAKQKYIEHFMKEGGIKFNKAPEKKVLPNAPCPCGSEKKYKKCCSGMLFLWSARSILVLYVHTVFHLGFSSRLHCHST